jgi:hypothetical protein
MTLAPIIGSLLVSRTTPFTCTVALAWVTASLALAEATGIVEPKTNIPAQTMERNLE